METPNSTRCTPLRRPAMLLAAITAALTLIVASANIAPAHADPGDVGRLERLNRQIAKLEKQTGGDLELLKDARRDAHLALQKADSFRDDLAGARALVAQMAASQYMSSGVDPAVAMLATDDPTSVLDGATLAGHISSNQAGRVRQIETLVRQQEQARKQAQQKIASLNTSIRKLARDKAKIQAQIKKFKPESPSIGLGGITPRMANVKRIVDLEFGPFVVIGCTRPGDPQDHGSGRACDFMESSGGQMPSADRQANGDQVANYAIRNGSKLGVKYVIWRQRIYDMRSPGWRTMSDRGSVTQNHYDHVHISVF